MPRERKRPTTAATAPIGLAQYIKLENRLVLLAWLNSLLGYVSNKDLFDDTKDTAESLDASGRSLLYHRLISRGDKVKIPADDLERYDENIRVHLAAINRGRTEPISLRYFQYLAVLYTEIVLDYYFNRRAQLLADLNVFVRKRNAVKSPVEPLDEKFTKADLTKLAYWMATGSGKTLILHLNYHQFLHYNTEPLENILLITPNEGLSDQHLAELAASGILARRFDLNQSGMFTSGRNEIQVIEITKLVEEKKGSGVSVPVEAFEGRNLIFVDEGHKGSGGEAWRKYRDALGITGFTFEYSATFGQALSITRNDPLTAEYGKAIIFDYSYRYFYSDGYGKDFRILNLKEDNRKEQTEMLLLGNLLSFYEQQCVFQEQAAQLRPYNIEKPLWVFVGRSVLKGHKSSEDIKLSSDVLTVVRFLHHVLENKRGWVVASLEKLLNGKSGLITSPPENKDIFAGRFEYLSEIDPNPQAIYEDILARLFHVPAGGGLHLYDIRGSGGELGLKASGAEDYFGLIYIGDTSEFKKLVESDQSGIILDDDVISGSLFEVINRPDSQVNILIGAKKFMEGWNSWRVSNMGLLNIGRQEGSQIIQLFGRGVRLRGMGHSLKRSASLLEGKHPPRVRLLETLNIFSVRAEGMKQFLNYIEREGVETQETIELPLFIWTNKQFLNRGLVLPRLEEGRNFAKETNLFLEADPTLRVHVDVSAKVQSLESNVQGLQTVDVRAGVGQTIPPESLELVNWEQVYFDLLAYKERKGLNNLVFRPEVPRMIFKSVNYTLIADDLVIKPRSFTDRTLLQEAATHILRKYIDSFYRNRREKWESQNLVYQILDEKDPDLAFNSNLVGGRPKGTYIVKVRKSDGKLIEAIENLSKDITRLREQETDELPRIYFDRHLYLPLLLEKNDKVHTIPPGLKESEMQFVRDLKAYWAVEKDNSLTGKEVFLLRNLSRGSGVGFFEESGFYPDFILWVIDDQSQRVVFIEPHGMLHAKANIHDEKVKLHKRLPELAKEITKRSKKKNIMLDSFIISATKYSDLHLRYDGGTWDLKKFTDAHILFMEQKNYIKTIFIS